MTLRNFPEDEKRLAVGLLKTLIEQRPAAKVETTIAIQRYAKLMGLVWIQQTKESKPEIGLFSAQDGTSRAYVISAENLIQEVEFEVITQSSEHELREGHEIDEDTIEKLAIMVQRIWPEKLTWNDKSHLHRVKAFTLALEFFCQSNGFILRGDQMLIDIAHGDESFSITPAGTIGEAYILKRELSGNPLD